MKPVFTPVWDQDGDIAGFDIDLVGFDCIAEIEPEDWGKAWRCPFRPGCGAASARDCPLRKQLSRV